MNLQCYEMTEDMGSIWRGAQLFQEFDKMALAHELRCRSSVFNGFCEVHTAQVNVRNVTTTTQSICQLMLLCLNA